MQENPKPYAVYRTAPGQSPKPLFTVHAYTLEAAATVLRLIRTLPGERAFLPPSPPRGRNLIASLTPASRRQDHATSPSAPCRSSAGMTPAAARRVHRIPHSTSRDVRDTPLFMRRDARKCGGDLPDGASGLFVAEWHDGQFAHGGHADSLVDCGVTSQAAHLSPSMPDGALRELRGDGGQHPGAHQTVAVELDIANPRLVRTAARVTFGR